MTHVMPRDLARGRKTPEDPARSALPVLRPALQLLAVCAVALTTANCANNPAKLAGGASSGSEIDPKYGVKASRRLYNEGDVIPKGGGRRFSGKPYVVAGKTYVPREDARGYVREGLASWYGSAFHGRVTANGEVFDRHSIAAAHPTLPLPSYVRVTNLDNGHSMILRVNDRGPYHAGRLMDVSEEAARALEFHRKGTARVRVEYAGKASIAGSDDRKLLATLRTDGSPAAIGRAPVMMADLGPSEPDPAPERLERASRALAFRPAGERDDDAPETAGPAARPSRPAPVVLASAAVAVPAALQPTAARAAPFRPAPVALAAAAKPTASEPRRMVAEAGRTVPPAHGRHRDMPVSAPMRLASAPAKGASVPVRTAQAEPVKVVATKTAPVQQIATKGESRGAFKPAGKVAVHEPAPRMAAMPATSKQAIAKLAGTAPTPGAKPAAKTAAAQAPGPSGSKPKRSQVAAAN
ncbi:septal ring lytic transglycosylase RlpA family protein [Methylobacterium sp. R2-1]|uniref:septal ring lytic transglycosylase RlpA family protein n=1 Tax=Methylobacterium sp. R2-1 TaxID=2587064 RepID=UPI00161E59DB|nr:septal ring lytic transglycosylase RlpA family protein [Methylobacterium sp. R2-1]MBB2962434.1 rare lipoprotein A [Methylobacterium sp. R2-1]